jgi:hypothetical protein
MNKSSLINARGKFETVKMEKYKQMMQSLNNVYYVTKSELFRPEDQILSLFKKLEF